MASNPIVASSSGDLISGLLVDPAELLRPEALAANVEFDGNRPRISSAYRARVLTAIVGEVARQAVPIVIQEAKSGSPWSAALNTARRIIQPHVGAIVSIPTNLRRIKLNRAVTDALVQRMDQLDAELDQLAADVDRTSDPELWDLASKSIVSVGIADLDAIWKRYRTEYANADGSHDQPARRLGT